MLVIADQIARWIWISFSFSTKSSDLKHINPKLQAIYFTFHENKAHFKLATPERHGETNGLAERSILLLRTLARSALKHSKLSTDWWKFAVNYTSFVENRSPHITLENLTPCKNFSWLQTKTSTCKTHRIVPSQQRKDKFNDVSIPLIFLGFDPLASFLTCTLLNKRTKRISHSQLQDIHFVETKFHDSISRGEKLPLIKISKHSTNLYETDSTESIDTDDDSTTEPSQSLNFETNQSISRPEESSFPDVDTVASAATDSTTTTPVKSSNLDSEHSREYPIFKQSYSRKGRTLKLPK
eukprot:maker-scaffold_4-snap-gene-1.39-mRNA-1 protein AED:0.38 eAED:0.47 QI:0/0/0/0.5/0/0/4/0/296